MREIRELFEVRREEGRALLDLGDVARAATYGAIDTVLVDIDEVVPGSIDEETGAITLSPAPGADSYGVVDEIARRAWLAGGRVLAVRRDDIPAHGSLRRSSATGSRARRRFRPGFPNKRCTGNPFNTLAPGGLVGTGSGSLGSA